MLATREQLEARWETPAGRAMAEKVCTLLETGVQQEGGQAQKHTDRSDPRATALWPSFPINTADIARQAVTANELQDAISSLPFQEEVAPVLDLRGLHRDQGAVKLLKDLDLSGAHLDYMEIDMVGASRMVGTIFDHCRSINALFIADFTSASFVQALLPGVKFLEATLVDANFRQAKLALAELRECNCQNVLFIEADLRFVDAWHADLQKANLTGADLTEANLAKANLSGIQFNEQTRLQGTNLYGAILDDPFRAFAEQAGAILREDQDPSFTEHERAKLAAIITILQRDNDDGRLDPAIACLIEQARHFANDPSYPWSMEMHQQLSPEMEQEVIERYGEVGRTLAYYL